MAGDEHELITLAREINRSLTDVKAKVAHLERLVAALDLPQRPQPRCPRCDLRTLGELALAEHLYHVHDGPEPEHWLEAERRAEP